MRLKIGRLEIAITLRKSAPMKHGTRSAYERGCRCEECVTARRNYQRTYMKQAREKGKWKK